MTEAIKILEKEIEMIKGGVDCPFFGEEYVEEMISRIPNIQKAIDYLKEAKA